MLTLSTSAPSVTRLKRANRLPDKRIERKVHSSCST